MAAVLLLKELRYEDFQDLVGTNLSGVVGCGIKREGIDKERKVELSIYGTGSQKSHRVS